jgi:hypothetical protein
LPDSLGLLVRRCKVPVVVAIHRGNYLHAPFWNFRKKRRVPLHTTLTLVLTAEEAATLSTEEINDRIKAAMQYDDYRYQQENGIRITEPFRAEGLHKILYRCPACRTDHVMDSKGTALFCTHCGKRWTLEEDGSLKATEGENFFTRVPDWFEWERAEVRAEIEAGKYRFSDTVDVHSLPRCWNFEALGEATLTHDAENGFVLEGNYRGAPYRIQRLPLQTNSLHVEYDFPHIKPLDCVDISTENDSFYCFPTKQNVVTKLSLATEEIYQMQLAELRCRRSKQKTT